MQTHIKVFCFCSTFFVLGWMHTLAERLKYNNISEISNVEAYVTALYYTFTSLTSVGFGNVSANTSAEKVFTIVMMLIGGKFCRQIILRRTYFSFTKFFFLFLSE